MNGLHAVGSTDPRVCQQGQACEHLARGLPECRLDDQCPCPGCGPATLDQPSFPAEATRVGAPVSWWRPGCDPEFLGDPGCGADFSFRMTISGHLVTDKSSS